MTTITPPKHSLLFVGAVLYALVVCLISVSFANTRISGISSAISHAVGALVCIHILIKHAPLFPPFKEFLYWMVPIGLFVVLAPFIAPRGWFLNNPAATQALTAVFVASAILPATCLSIYCLSVILARLLKKYLGE